MIFRFGTDILSVRYNSTVLCITVRNAHDVETSRNGPSRVEASRLWRDLQYYSL